MLAEDWQSFFHSDEFAVMASIKGVPVPGILESSQLTVNHVQCCQFKFTCAQILLPTIQLDDEIKMRGEVYRILEIKPDGTGLVHLLLEATP